MDYHNKHYIRTDAQGRVIHGFSDAFEAPQDSDHCIDEQGGYQFRLTPGGLENPPLTDIEGVHLYRLDGEAVVETLGPEHEAERAAIQAALPLAPPTEQERMSALEAAMLAVMGGEGNV